MIEAAINANGCDEGNYVYTALLLKTIVKGIDIALLRTCFSSLIFFIFFSKLDRRCVDLFGLFLSSDLLDPFRDPLLLPVASVFLCPCQTGKVAILVGVNGTDWVQPPSVTGPKSSLHGHLVNFCNAMLAV